MSDQFSQNCDGLSSVLTAVVGSCSDDGDKFDGEIGEVMEKIKEIISLIEKTKPILDKVDAVLG